MDHHEFLRYIIRENLKRQPLYEGLIYSHSPTTVIKKIKKLGFRDISYNMSDNTIVINFILDNSNKERYKKLNDLLYNVYGWNHGMSIVGGHPAEKKLDFLNYTQGIVFLKYEAKFDIELSELPEKIYHLTTYEKLKKILKQGLTPRTSKEYFNFEDRIYFSLKPGSLINFLKQKSAITKKKHFIVLEINISSLSFGVRFFQDPNFQGGIYTLENIIPFAIRPIEKILVGNTGNIISREKYNL